MYSVKYNNALLGVREIASFLSLKDAKKLYKWLHKSSFIGDKSRLFIYDEMDHEVVVL